VLDRLNLNDLLEDTFHLESAEFLPKPNLDSYHAMIRKHGVDPKCSAFFEDSEKNLKPAFEIGMTTILVGPKAQASTADFVHHRTRHLTPFLNSALLGEAARKSQA
jgi:putative hydrolase of the HAD superfamily